MSKKTISLIWWVCLMIMCVSGLIVSVPRIIGITLPDILQRVIGVVSLVSLAVFGFASALRYKAK